jgi:chromatin remodeling complex protein RSC6
MNMVEVYKAVVQYIKDNNLQNIENRKNINLDEKLETLLAPNDDEEVTFFNLKTFLEKHFIS